MLRKLRGLPPNGMLEETEPTYERLYWPMGEPLLLQTSDPVFLEMAEQSLGRFRPPEPQHGTPSHSLLLLRLFPHDLGAESLASRQADHPRPIFRTQRHLLYVSIGAGSTVVADLERGEAFGFIAPEVAHDAPLFRTTFLEGLSLILLTTARQFIPLHAAAVVKGGVSLILHGRAGTGKSTLAYACVRRGYQLLSEDGLLVKAPPEPMRLWGIPWWIHLLPDATRFFPELANERPKLQINGEWKFEIELESRFLHATTNGAAPGQVLFLERCASGVTRFEPLPLTKASDAFEIVWPWGLDWTASREEGVQRLLERRAYRFLMSGPPDEAVDALDEFVTQLGNQSQAEHT